MYFFINPAEKALLNEVIDFQVPYISASALFEQPPRLDFMARCVCAESRVSLTHSHSALNQFPPACCSRFFTLKSAALSHDCVARQPPSAKTNCSGAECAAGREVAAAAAVNFLDCVRGRPLLALATFLEALRRAPTAMISSERETRKKTGSAQGLP